MLRSIVLFQILYYTTYQRQNKMKSIQTLTEIQSLVPFIGLCVCTVLFSTRMIPCVASQNDLNPYKDEKSDVKFPRTKIYDLAHFDDNADYSMMRINETFKLFREVYQRIQINTSSKEVVSELQDLLMLLENFRQYTKILTSSTLDTKGNDSQTYLNVTNSEQNFSGDSEFINFNDNVMEFFSHTLGRLNCTISIELYNEKHHDGTKNAEICTNLDFDANSNDRY